MLEARKLRDVPEGLVLIHDPEDPTGQWSLWRFEAEHHRILVSWKGVVFAPGDASTVQPVAWADSVASRCIAYLVTERTAEFIIMAARHMSDMEVWFRFCERQVERQESPCA